MRIFIFKKIIAFIILLALCAYATWKGMQTLAIFTIILFLCLLYNNITSNFLDILSSMIKRAKNAKYKDFELSLDDPFKQLLLDCVSSEDKWAKAVISDLNSNKIALLLAISKIDKFKCNNSIKNDLRDLRKMALIEHDKKTMAESETVWLTQNGKDLVLAITKASTSS